MGLTSSNYHLDILITFYNVRGKELDEFPPPEIKETVNTTELGNLGLSDSDEDDLVAFLETLTDEELPPLEPQSNARKGYGGVRDILRVEQYRHKVIQASGIKNTERR